MKIIPMRYDRSRYKRSERIPDRTIYVGRIFKNARRSAEKKLGLTLGRERINSFLMMIRRHAHKSDFKIGVLKRIDAPNVQFDSCLSLYLIGVIEKEFISRHEKWNHAKVRFSQPRKNI